MTQAETTLDVKKLVERIANGAVPFLITDKGKQELYPMAGIDVARYAELIAAELAPVLEENATLKAANDCLIAAVAFHHAQHGTSVSIIREELERKDGRER